VEHALPTAVFIAFIIAVGAIVIGAIGAVVILEVRRRTLYRGRHF
jgi:hypothetical protein